MKFLTISTSFLVMLPTVLGQRTEGPYYFVGTGTNTIGNLNLTATNGNILLGDNLPRYQFLFQISSGVAGYMDVLGFGEGYSRVYADNTDGTVRYTAPAEQPPAGSIADRWILTALESDPQTKVLEFGGGQLLACTNGTTGVASLRATNATKDPCCEYVSLTSQPNPE